MSNEQFYFDWDISKLESTKQVGNYSDVVTCIVWTLWGSDEHGNKAPLYGETKVNVEFLRDGGTSDNWIDFSKLSKQDIETLLEDQLGEDEIVRLTDNLKVQLQQMQSTEQTTLQTPPWLVQA